MKKVIKYSLLIIGCLVLVAGGYLFYELKIKEYDVVDAQVDEIINENITVDLPDGTKLVLDAEGNIVEEIAPATTNASVNEFEIKGEDVIVQVENNIITAVLNKNHEPIEHETIKIGQAVQETDGTVTIITEKENVAVIPATPPSNTKLSVTQPVEKATVATIKSKYAGSFAALEGQAKGRLNSLISQAKAEYSTKVANGESVNYSYFYQKYYGAATAMESTIDASFNTLYARLQSELEQNQFDKTHAQSFKNQYEAAKSSLRSELLSKIK